MCGSIADIQSPTAEIRLGKKERRRKKKPQGKNITVCPILNGDHNNHGFYGMVVGLQAVVYVV